MPAYISEFNYYGTESSEFVEIAVPEGTDVSNYSVTLYMSNGQSYASFSLGSSVATMGGHDIYLIDGATPGFDSGGSSMGMFWQDDAIALSDGTNVVQFVSYWGNTVTATEGPASGMTSTDVGSVGGFGRSLQSDDGGASYYEQTSANQGSIPACYGRGTRIATPFGERPVEDLKAGDLVMTESGPQPIVWVWRGTQALDGTGYTVLISKGALGAEVGPERDLVVSPQHRIRVGNALAPAKALTGRKGLREMRGKRRIEWFHFACARHHLVRANGLESESLLLGPMIVASLSRREQLELLGLYGKEKPALGRALNGPPALPCLTVRQARDMARGREAAALA